MLKCVFRHIGTVKAKIRVSAQSDQGLHCPLTESFDATECMENKYPDDTVHVQDDLNLPILQVFERHFYASRGKYLNLLGDAET